MSDEFKDKRSDDANSASNDGGADKEFEKTVLVWRKRGKLLGWVYGGLGAIFILLAAVCPQWIQGWRPLFRNLIPALFSLAPPVYFAVEFWKVDSAVDRNVARGKTEDCNPSLRAKGKAVLDSVKTYQDVLSKIWVAVAAAIVFLYATAFEKKPTTYTCIRQDEQHITCVQTNDR